MDSIIISYIAGFLDGEGSIYVADGGIKTKKLANGKIKKYFKGWNTNVIITNTHKGVLEFIQKHIGGRLYKRSYKQKSYHHTVYSLSFTTQKSIETLLDTIFPFLIVKKQQAQIMLNYVKSRLKKNKKYGQAFPYTPNEMNLLRQLKKVQQESSAKAKSYKTIPFSDRTEKASIHFLKNRIDNRNQKSQFTPI